MADLQCEVCNMKFNTEIALEEHKNKHIPKRSSDCGCCSGCM